MTDLDSLLAQPLLCTEATYGEGDAAITVQIRQLDRRELEAVGTAGVKVIRERGGTERREVNVDAFRKALRDAALVGWDGLTVAKFCSYVSRVCPEGKAHEPVQFTPDNALTLLRNARTLIAGESVAFEEWLFSEASRASAQYVREQASSGKG